MMMLTCCKEFPIDVIMGEGFLFVSSALKLDLESPYITHFVFLAEEIKWTDK